MFLQDVHDGSAPDIDDVEQRLLNRRFRYRQTLHKGQVVLIGSDNRKRIDRPFGVKTEFIPGKNKQVRLMKEKTSHCTLLRPIQMIYPLEVDSSKDFSNPLTDLEEQRRGDNVPNPSDLRDISKGKLSLDQIDEGYWSTNITRTGRHVKIPRKFNL
ncbi:DUF5641 domain-containing protein [Caerostris darwini]|uniref:DUF5641 domain-containing protein n=1 Tax=Caerostris darwini TaxID=1538125 RepID=A0AAV4T8M2_9ARAC|nr:DUF5641 domain-containing protein [Caerostris darwini]